MIQRRDVIVTLPKFSLNHMTVSRWKTRGMDTQPAMTDIVMPALNGRIAMAMPDLLANAISSQRTCKVINDRVQLQVLREDSHERAKEHLTVMVQRLVTEIVSANLKGMHGCNLLGDLCCCRYSHKISFYPVGEFSMRKEETKRG
jgi:hypothetical protein